MKNEKKEYGEYDKNDDCQNDCPFRIQHTELSLHFTGGKFEVGILEMETGQVRYHFS